MTTIRISGLTHSQNDALDKLINEFDMRAPDNDGKTFAEWEVDGDQLDLLEQEFNEALAKMARKYGTRGHPFASSHGVRRRFTDATKEARDGS